MNHDTWGDQAVMTMAQKSLQHVTTDPAVDTTLTLVAEMVGLPKETVTKIVEAGLPIMADVADGDLVVFKAMYAQSVKNLPHPTQAFYEKLGKNVTARQALAAAFKRMYGPMTETITRGAAGQASATEEQASQVLAVTMPAVVQAVGRASSNGNELSFGRQLRNLNA
jgi:hypothetical protein